MSGQGPLHASCVALDGRGVLIAGASGAGKSDLALRLIDSGARLVSDDQTLLREEGGVLIAAPPPQLAGLIELRGIGLVRLPYLEKTPVELFVDLAVPAQGLERLPDPSYVSLCGVAIRRLCLEGKTASAPAAIRAILKYGIENV